MEGNGWFLTKNDWLERCGISWLVRFNCWRCGFSKRGGMDGGYISEHGRQDALESLQVHMWVGFGYFEVRSCRNQPSSSWVFLSKMITTSTETCLMNSSFRKPTCFVHSSLFHVFPYVFLHLSGWLLMLLFAIPFLGFHPNDSLTGSIQTFESFVINSTLRSATWRSSMSSWRRWNRWMIVCHAMPLFGGGGWQSKKNNEQKCDSNFW